MIVTKNRPRSVDAVPEPKAARKPSQTKTSAAPAVPAALPALAPPHGIIMGVLVGFDAAMQAQVEFDGNPAPAALPALTLAPLAASDIGKPVALQFEHGNLMRPVVMGLLYSSANAEPPGQAAQPQARLATPAAAEADQPPLHVTQDGADVTLTAYGRLTLQCGRASLTLDVNGDIELRGRDVLSRAAGQNRIKGSSISLN